MPNIIKKILICVLTAAMVFPVFTQTSYAKKEELSLPYLELPVTVETITVGLRSGSSALYEAKLQNRVGSGYNFGYFDITRSFRTLGYTFANAISVRGDSGFNLNEETYVGSWHILLNYYYSDFDNAKSSATSVGGFPAYINGQYRVMIGAYADKESADKAIQKGGYTGSAYTGSSSSLLIAETNTANLLFVYDNPGSHKLAIFPLTDGQDEETWFSGYYYRGAFEFTKKDNGAINVTNYVDLESYVGGVLPYEMNGAWPLEALKSQAVCARTYAINNLNSYARNGYDVRSDTYSQVYRGITESTDTTVEAAEVTSCEYARYKGAICKVYYMSSDGGTTESGENTFKQRRDYLSAVKDPFESDIEHFNETWEIRYTPFAITSKLNSRGYEMAEVCDIVPTVSDSGNVIALKFTDINGREAEIFNVDCYKILGLNSLNYTVSKTTDEENEKTITFVFDGHGWGHNCGLSQWGSYSMAEYHGKNYNEIIDYYFSGAYVK